MAKLLLMLMMVGVWSGCGGGESAPTGSIQEITKAPDGSSLELKITEWYNGNIKEEFQYYRNGGQVIKHGFSKSYTESGALYDEDTYREGTCIADCEWMKTFGKGVATSIRETTDGGFIIGGSIDSDVVLLKVDAAGNEKWRHTLDGADWYPSALQTTDGGYILAASRGDDDRKTLLKTNVNGSKEWENDYGEGTLWEVAQSQDEGFILAGATNDGAAIIKTDSGGNQLWSYVDTSRFSYNGVAITNDGGFVVGATGGHIMKFDVQGNVEWESTPFDGRIELYSIAIAFDGGYAIGGVSYNSVTPYPMILKTDRQGNEEWRYTYEQGYSWGWSVQQTSDGGFVTALNSERGPDLIKTDDQGNELWVLAYKGIRVTLDATQLRSGGFGLAGGFLESDLSDDEFDIEFCVSITDEFGRNDMVDFEQIESSQ